jgi:hypothetical protein
MEQKSYLQIRRQENLKSDMDQKNIFVSYQLDFYCHVNNNAFHPSNDATAQIGPWPPLLRFSNNNVLRCEVVSVTTNPR